jgi:hypothetical protein
MYRAFSNANVFNQYIGDWDVSNVTDMQYMFSNGRYPNGVLSLTYFSK